MRIKTSELSGPPLDWAVAVAEGRWQKYIRDEARPLTGITDIDFDETGTLKVYVPGPSRELSGRRRDPYEVWSPSTNGLQGVLIIEREFIHLRAPAKGVDLDALRIPFMERNQWFARVAASDTSYLSFGPTALVAAMRCHVMSSIGDEVFLPKELC